jgi:hypothetical protein
VPTAAVWNGGEDRVVSLRSRRPMGSTPWSGRGPEVAMIARDKHAMEQKSAGTWP